MLNKSKQRIKRHKRLRKKVFGTNQKPRLCIYRGLANIHAQLIDDLTGETLLSVSTQDKDLKKQIGYGGNIKAASLLGEILAKRAQQKNISKVVFDRGGVLYHGRVKALAEAARQHNLKF